MMGLGMSKTLIGSQLGIGTGGSNTAAGVEGAKSRLSTHGGNSNKKRGAGAGDGAGGGNDLMIDSSNGVPMIVTADPLAQNSMHNGKKSSGNNTISASNKFNQTVAGSHNNNNNLYSMIY